MYTARGERRWCQQKAPKGGSFAGRFQTPVASRLDEKLVQKLKMKSDMDVSKNLQNGWCLMENPLKMDDLGVPLFLETPIS